jgi:hypothetical protein
MNNPHRHEGQHHTPPSVWTVQGAEMQDWRQAVLQDARMGEGDPVFQCPARLPEVQESAMGSAEKV